MSSTTDIEPTTPTCLALIVSKAGRGVSILLLLSCTAIAIQAAVFAATGSAPAAIVLMPPESGPTGLPPDVTVLQWYGRYAVVTADRRDYVRRLYGKGALLVLPFRKSGCLSFR
jgi:hypothetical protein